MALSQPDIADVHVNSILTNASIGWKPRGFFADRVFPIVPVDRQTDIYAKFNKSFWARDLGAPGAAPTGSYQAVRRAPGTAARTVGYGTDVTNTYKAVNYALGVEIPTELRANADAVWNLDAQANQLLNTLLRLRFDREFVADFIDTSVYGALTISNKWSDYSAGTPIEDMRAGVDTVRKQTLGMSDGGGLKLVIGTLVERRLLDHPDIIERVKYTGSQGNPAQVTRSVLAQLFGVDEIIVGKAVYTSDEEGTAEASVTYTDVISDDVLLVWTPNTPQLMMPSAGYLFNWNSAVGGPNALTFTRRGTDERHRYDWIEVHAYLDWVATETSSGVFNSDACD